MALLAWWVAVGWADEPIGLPVFREEELPAVADRKYPKAGRTELGVHAGLMPFDALLTTPDLQLSVTGHRSERVGLTLQIAGGWGFPTATMRTLASPTYDARPDTWRYVASAIAGGDWTPVYGKAFVGGRIVHFDAYVAKRAGLTLQTSTADGRWLVAPTFSPTVGGRVFLGPSSALRVEFRYDLLVEIEPATLDLGLGQNAAIRVGWVALVGKGAGT